MTIQWIKERILERSTYFLSFHFTLIVVISIQHQEVNAKVIKLIEATYIIGFLETGIKLEFRRLFSEVIASTRDFQQEKDNFSPFFSLFFFLTAYWPREVLVYFHSDDDKAPIYTSVI